MFIGHFAVALGAKRAAPRTSLGLLFAAALLSDMLWPVFLLAGIERASLAVDPNPFLTISLDHFPWSHSLAATLLWASLFVGGCRLLGRDKSKKTAAVVFLCVLSHWILDFISHRPDMPLYPGGPRLGLGLYNFPVATATIEYFMFAVGSWIYLTSTRGLDKVGRWAIPALLLFLALCYSSTFVTGAPPTIRALALGGLIFGWLFVAWAAWGDAHRSAAVAFSGPRFES